MKRLIWLVAAIAVLLVAAALPALRAPEAHSPAVIGDRAGYLTQALLQIQPDLQGRCGAASIGAEVFTGWAFVFNDPDNCTDPCDGDDLPLQGAVFNIGGLANSGGGSLTIAGHVDLGTTPASPFGALTNPLGAEIHVAIAPHGALDPATLPTEFRVPAGSPFCGCWWVAVFEG